MAKVSTYDIEDTPALTDYFPGVRAADGANVRYLMQSLGALLSSADFISIEGLSYSSWSITTRIGVLSSIDDLRTLIGKGTRVKINQTTGGDKYFIVVAIDASTITGFFQSGATLENEAINTSEYSNKKAPIGFPLAASNWSLEYTNTSDSTITDSASWNNGTSDNLVVGIGSWKITAKAFLHTTMGGSSAEQQYETTLSTDGSTETNENFSSGISVRGDAAQKGGGSLRFIRDILTVTSQTTLYLLGRHGSGSASSTISIKGTWTTTRIKAVCAYL